MGDREAGLHWRDRQPGLLDLLLALPKVSLCAPSGTVQPGISPAPLLREACTNPTSQIGVVVEVGWKWASFTPNLPPPITVSQLGVKGGGLAF